MIASMLKLSRADCKALRITDAYSIHRVVYNLFAGTSRDFLFADKGGEWNSRTILILSERSCWYKCQWPCCQWNARTILILSERAPAVPEHGEINSKRVPESFFDHQCYGFEITLNPTKREKESGKVVAIRGEEHLRPWLLEKAPRRGFDIDPASLSIRNAGVQTFAREDGTVVTHNSATFVGRLTVTDRAKFIDAFRTGIGRAKGFGFGLLQLVPLRNE